MYRVDAISSGFRATTGRLPEMKVRLISALVVVVTFAQHAAAQSLATPAAAVAVPEPSTGLLLGLSAGLYGLHRFLRRR